MKYRAIELLVGFFSGLGTFFFGLRDFLAVTNPEPTFLGLLGGSSDVFFLPLLGFVLLEARLMPVRPETWIPPDFNLLLRVSIRAIRFAMFFWSLLP